MKILHVITGLSLGGAENTLYKLCRHTQNQKHINVIISLTNHTSLARKFNDINIKVINLNIKKNIFLIFKLYRLYKLIKSIKPDVVQTWMFHSDLIGGIVAKCCGIKKIYWNFRHSDLKFGKSKISTIIIYYLLILLSYFIPNVIISCSRNVIKNSKKNFFSKNKFLYIGNGFNLDELKFTNKDYLYNLRNVNYKNKFILGMLANYRPQKNHKALLNALLELKKTNINFLCLLAGDYISNNNNELINLIKKCDLSKNIILLGKITNVANFMSCLDIHVLASDFGEAFPNVLAEAMSCEVPCIANDVGDSKEIIANNGIVVDTNNAILFANSINYFINLKNNQNIKWLMKKTNARDLIYQNYEIDSMCNKYIEAWQL